MPLINWHPIDNIPDDRMDGRPMLVWAAAPYIAEWSYYDNPLRNGPAWEEPCDRMVIAGVTHWADINAPDGSDEASPSTVHA